MFLELMFVLGGLRWVLLIPTVIFSSLWVFDVLLSFCFLSAHTASSLSRIARYAFVCKGRVSISFCSKKS